MYKDTKEAVTYLKKMGRTEQAKNYANEIMQNFNSFEEKDKLAQWIANNTAPSGEGAYPVLHDLFQTVANIKNRPHAFSSNINTGGPLASLKYIDAQSLNYINKSKDAGGLVNDAINLVVKNFVQSHSPKEIKALRITSETTRQQVSQSYRGPLKELNIKNAEQAIEYVKKYGENLSYIDISSIKFTPKQLKTFIGYLPNLTVFFAENCNFTKEHAQEITALKNLTILGLPNNHIGDEGVKAIAALTKLTQLGLANNHIGDEGVKAIAVLTKLTRLGLADNHIGDEGAKAIAAALIHLILLELNNNHIGDEGVKAIAVLIKLKQLGLAHNRIGDAGAKEIAATLTQLTKLVLSNNHIGDAGAKEIAVTLTNLTELYLDNNNIGDVGALEFIERLTNLKIIYLDDNRIGKRATRALIAFIKEKPDMKFRYSILKSWVSQKVMM